MQCPLGFVGNFSLILVFSVWNVLQDEEGNYRNGEGVVLS